MNVSSSNARVPNSPAGAAYPPPFFAKYRLSPVAALLTHGHFDHVYAVAPVCDGNDIQAWIHPEDREMLADPLKGLSLQATDFFGGRNVRTGYNDALCGRLSGALGRGSVRSDIRSGNRRRWCRSGWVLSTRAGRDD